jgi:tetratricopeptide (TPR) repeat protein
MKRVAALALLLACALFAPVARGTDSLDSTFARGNAAFARGDYEAAVRAYETLVEAGIEDPDVSYNLASAHGSLGHYGQAIQFFERTLRLEPGDDQARASLKRARDALGQKQALESGEAIVADRPPLTEALFGALTVDALALWLLVSTWLCAAAACALFYVRAESVRLSLGILATLGLVAALVSGLGLLVRADFEGDGARAVVLHEHAPVREGPDASARLWRELPEGSPVRVLKREGNFVRIRTGEHEGYMHVADVGEI